MIPVPVPRTAGPVEGSRTNVDAQTSRQIVVGQATRTDVVALLGEPDGRALDDSWFTYGSLRRLGGIGWADSLRDYGDWNSSNRLVVRFDKGGVVSSTDFSERNCTASRHDCLDPAGSDLAGSSGRNYPPKAEQSAR